MARAQQLVAKKSYIGYPNVGMHPVGMTGVPNNAQL